MSATTAMPVRREKSSITKSPARRCLFERSPDSEPNDQFVKRLLDEIHESYKAKWEFDFVTDTPLQKEGSSQRFVYERVKEENVPGFYRISSYSPVCPPLRRSNNENKHFNAKAHRNVSIEEEMDSENVDPLHFCHHQRASRFFNTSCSSQEESFGEYDEEPLLNDSTSSSGSSASEVSLTTVAKNCDIDFNVSCTSKLFQLETSTTCFEEDINEENCCVSSECSLLSTSSKRASLRKSAVTPKKQIKLTEFITQRRKNLQRSAKKSDLSETKSPVAKVVSPRHKKWQQQLSKTTSETGLSTRSGFSYCSTVSARLAAAASASASASVAAVAAAVKQRRSHVE